jgi:leader peptidase (prepilin peptidase)/N-methyltransferase
MVIAFVVLATVVGMAIGSFLNVVAYRVPAGLSVVSPASACPGCGHEIRGRDNVPVASWLLLRGRCRDCRMPISARYPLLELATGVAFLAVAAAFAPAISDAVGASALVAEVLTLVAFLYLAAISILLTAIDLDVRRLPNSIVLPSYLVGGIPLTAAALLGGRPEVLLVAGIGLVASVLFYGVLWFAKPGGMGFGDVKAAGVLGMYLGFLGWPQLAVGVAAAFLLGGLFGLALLATRRAGRGTSIPFGPWMFLGAWIGIVVGEPLADGYLRFVGLG